MKSTITTERLTIRPLDNADKKLLAELLTNENIKKTYMIPDFASQAELEKMLDKLLYNSLSEAHFERGIYLNDTLIGFCNDVEISGGEIELGYVIHPEHWSKGYATEMLSAVIETLLSYGYERVTCGAFCENKASIRVMQKCGMTKKGKEEDIDYKGKKHHCVYYSAVKA